MNLYKADQPPMNTTFEHIPYPDGNPVHEVGLDMAKTAKGPLTLSAEGIMNATLVAVLARMKTGEPYGYLAYHHPDNLAEGSIWLKNVLKSMKDGGIVPTAGVVLTPDTNKNLFHRNTGAPKYDLAKTLLEILQSEGEAPSAALHTYHVRPGSPRGLRLGVMLGERGSAITLARRTILKPREVLARGQNAPTY